MTRLAIEALGAATTSEQPDEGGAHGGQVVDVDEDRAPAPPTRVALDHRRQDGVGRRHQVGVGDGGAVVAHVAVAAGAQVAEHLGDDLLGRRLPGDEADRPAHPHVGVAEQLDGPATAGRGGRRTAPCRPDDRRTNAPSASARRRRPHQRRAVRGGEPGATTRRLPTHQPSSGTTTPPSPSDTWETGRGGRRRTAPWRLGPRAPALRVVVEVVAVGPGEDALVLDEGAVPQGGVGGDGSVGLLDDERRADGGRPGAAELPQERLADAPLVRTAEMGRPSSRDMVSLLRRRGRSTPRTPRSPRPGPLPHRQPPEAPSAGGHLGQHVDRRCWRRRRRPASRQGR